MEGMAGFSTVANYCVDPYIKLNFTLQYSNRCLACRVRSSRQVNAQVFWEPGSYATLSIIQPGLHDLHSCEIQAVPINRIMSVQTEPYILFFVRYSYQDYSVHKEHQPKYQYFAT